MSFHLVLLFRKYFKKVLAESGIWKTVTILIPPFTLYYLFLFCYFNFLLVDIEKLIFLITYEPLWETMKTKGISQYKLLKLGIDNRTLNNLKKNKNITVLTMEKLCNILECTPNDIVMFIKEEDSSITK